MRGVVVTVLPQPDPARDKHGKYRRLRMLLHAMKEVCDEIEIVHFARPDEMKRTVQANAEFSSFWGVPVRLETVPLNAQPRYWWHTGLLPFGLRYRRDFRPYLGSDQTAALIRIFQVYPALILAHRLPAMEAPSRVPGIRSPIFFGLEDVEHRVKARAARNARSPEVSKTVELPALIGSERRALARAAKTFVCSSFDRELLKDLNFDVSSTVIVPHATEVTEFRPALSPSRAILFIGNYGDDAEAEVAERLITRIWPKIRAKIQFAKLIIAGDHPELIPSFSSRPPDVEFTGFVRKSEALYAGARIVCCPICNGGGSGLRLIEAASYGNPIVATPVAVEGLEFSSAREVLIHHDDDGLATACARLLQDSALAESLAAAAHGRAQRLYTPSDLSGRIALEMRNGLAAHASQGHRLAGGGRNFLSQQFSGLRPTFFSAKQEN
jgi:glycosyltransferase involved in cell wall biosynthesis